MSYPRCRPLKIETISTGGATADIKPRELNPNIEGPDARCIYFQNATSADYATFVDRNASTGAIQLNDATVGVKTSTELVSSSLTATTGSHQKLLDIIHFLDNGPGDGWASGAVCVQSFSGPLLQSRIWYTDAGLASKIVGMANTFQGPLLQSRVWTLYGPSNAVVRQMTDQFSYAGILATKVVRTWT